MISVGATFVLEAAENVYRKPGLFHVNGALLSPDDLFVTENTQACYSNILRTQDTSKLTPPSAVQFVQGYRLEYVCCGFVQAHAWRWTAVRLVRPNV